MNTTTTQTAAATTAPRFVDIVFGTDPVTRREVELGRGGSQCETIAIERAAKSRGFTGVYTSRCVP